MSAVGIKLSLGLMFEYGRMKVKGLKFPSKSHFGRILFPRRENKIILEVRVLLDPDIRYLITDDTERIFPRLNSI